MRSIFTMLILLAAPRILAEDPVSFGRYFTDQTLRIDYYHSGNANTEVINLDKIYLGGSWAGNLDHCIQPFELGMYKAEVFDIATNRIIFSKGYNSLFSEYITTNPAIQGVQRTFHESVLIPCPRGPFILIIERRDNYNILSPIYRIRIDPYDYHINTEVPGSISDVVIPVMKHGDPHKCVDLVILSEGYQAGEQLKFTQDLTYYTKLLFSVEPFKSREKKFNITGIFSPSIESGTDEPRQEIYKNTRFGTSFNAFDLDRYCLTEDNKSIRDVAARVPYDAILIMVNRDRYGGGGIYNLETVFCTGSTWKDYVFLHEFGHAFAGLGDEYYSSPVTYQETHTPGVEPLEPNITALLDTAHVKWGKYLSPGIKVPTEWGKATFDSLNTRIAVLTEEENQTREELKKSGTGLAESERILQEYQDEINDVNKKIYNFINNHPLKNKVGVFEGANYVSRGLYRPTIMSLMHKFNDHDMSYGLVNEQAIIRIIDYYTGD